VARVFSFIPLKEAPQPLDTNLDQWLIRVGLLGLMLGCQHTSMWRDMAQQTPPPDIMEGLTAYRQSCRRADGIHQALLLSPPWSTYQPHRHLCAPSQVAIVWNSARFESNGSVPQYASTLNANLHSYLGE
jgi:hypothetical protein